MVAMTKIKQSFPFVLDLVDVFEMLQLPSERQHFETGCSVVYFVFRVRKLHNQF